MANHRPSNQDGQFRHGPGLHYLRVWAIALLLAAVVALVVPADLGWPVRGIAAWDAALVVLLGVPWRLILQADARITRQLAAVEDPGKFVLFMITILASAVSLLAAIVLLRDPGAFMPANRVGVLIALGGVAVVGAWTLVHTAFTFHYAHLYYREDDAPGGLDFPGGAEPDDLDFAYFAFTIGMAYQTSDVAVTDRELRRVVLRHAVLSFVFNTAILALAVSLLFGRLQ